MNCYGIIGPHNVRRAHRYVVSTRLGQRAVFICSACTSYLERQGATVIADRRGDLDARDRYHDAMAGLRS